jgi:uncharacterized alkaline shock family protein YloU
MLIVPLILVFPEQAESGLRYVADIIQANIVWLNEQPPATQIGVRLMLGGAGMLGFVIGLVFLALEIIRIRRKTVRLRDGSGELMMDGIAGHLSYYIDLLSDVLRVKPKVISKGKTVQVELYVETAPGVNIPAKTAEIKETARRVIEEELGLQIKGEVKVMIKPVYPRHDTPKKRMPKPAARPAARPEPVDAFLPAAEVALEDFATDKEIVEVKAPPIEEPAGE